MGKYLIIKGADFSANAVSIPVQIKVAAGKSITIGSTTYSAGIEDTSYILDTIPDLWKPATTDALKEFYIDVTDKRLYIAVDDNNGAFYDNDALKKVNIKSIKTPCSAKGMFNNCSSLELLRMSVSFNVIMAMAYNCSALKKVDLSGSDFSSVANMSGVFYNCSQLEEIVLGDFNINISNIGDSYANLFENCSSLSKIYVNDSDNTHDYPIASWLIARLSDASITGVYDSVNHVISCSH